MRAVGLVVCRRQAHHPAGRRDGDEREEHRARAHRLVQRAGSHVTKVPVGWPEYGMVADMRPPALPAPKPLVPLFGGLYAAAYGLGGQQLVAQASGGSVRWWRCRCWATGPLSRSAIRRWPSRCSPPNRRAARRGRRGPGGGDHGNRSMFVREGRATCGAGSCFHPAPARQRARGLRADHRGRPPVPRCPGGRSGKPMRMLEAAAN